MNWFELSFTFLGGLGMFFFGMKTLSEALQNMAGAFIRRVVNALTTNRLLALGVGAIVTTIIQSSSITTVMVVGFVNAGLMELTQAIGVIFGANIGTTITGWIIAIKVGKYGLLLVGLGMIPMMLPGHPTLKGLGRILLALGLIFLGLKFMSGAFKPLRDTEAFLNLLQYFSAQSYLSVFACVAVGAVLTFITQSSSAMLGVTIALAGSGAITFPTAAALVLGENIGTTITAWLASLGLNTNAKRAARAHIFFNVIGVMWLVPLFWFYLDIVDATIWGNPEQLAADGTKPFIAAHIAAGHTIFNVTNSILFLPFLKHLARLVKWITPYRDGKEVPHLEFIPNMTPTLAIAGAQKELRVLGDIVSRTLRLTRDYVLSDRPSRRDAEKIQHYEDVTDNIQSEITHFLVRIQESRMSREASSLANSLIRAADELESIADYCASLVRYRNRLLTTDQKIPVAAAKDLEEYFDNIVQLYEEILRDMQGGAPWDVVTYRDRVNNFISEANRIRDIHMKRLEEGKMNSSAGMVYSDIFVALRKIRGHAINVVEALSGSKTGSLGDG